MKGEKEGARWMRIESLRRNYQREDGTSIDDVRKELRSPKRQREESSDVGGVS
jgi:hypothetical protein